MKTQGCLWIDDLAGTVNPTSGSVGSDALPKLLRQIPGKEIVSARASTQQWGRTSFDRLYSGVTVQCALKRVDPGALERAASLHRD
jgi:hypothetical protein